MGEYAKGQLTGDRGDTHFADPLLGFNFQLKIEGKVAGYFTECSGIGSEHDVVEHKVVDDSGHEITRKIPGRLKWGDVTLKRGVTGDLEIWKWRDNVVQGKVTDARAPITITMFSRDYSNPIAIWHFANAWPSKVSGPNLKSDGNEFGVEEVTIVHEGMYREL
jgi:phage tail-like protein